MRNMLWPILLITGANVLYNISTKSTPGDINPFASLTITYAMAALVSVVLFAVTGGLKGAAAEFAKVNWASLALGAAIVLLELGYICAYRVGWKISIASLVTNILLACALLCVGFAVYHERITLTQLAGITVCAVGLVLVSGIV